MPIFKPSAAKTMRMLSGHISPRNASNFACSHRDLTNFPGRRKGRWTEGKGKWRTRKKLTPRF